MADQLFTEVRDAVAEGVSALRFADALEPTAGHRHPVQPPTYMADSGGEKYAVWQVGVVDADGAPVFHEGQRLTTTSVTVDSEASQSNRAEEGIATLVDDEVLDLPLLELVVNGAEQPELATFSGRRRFTNLTTPHREQDPLFRFALVSTEEYARHRPSEDISAIPETEPGLIPFARTELGRSIVTASADDLSPLLRYTPASLLFGFWHSYSNGQNAERPRLARRYASTIIAHDVFPVRSGGVKSATFNEDKDVRISTSAHDPLLFDVDNSKSAKGKASNLGAGAIPSALVDRGYTAERIDWTTTISVRGLLQTPVGEGTSREHRVAVATALLLLGIAGRAHSGLFLRSGCDLTTVPGGSRVEWVNADGSTRPWGFDAAPEPLGAAFSEAKATLDRLGGPGIGSHEETVRLRLSPGYRRLIDDSNPVPPIFAEEKGA